MSTSPFAPCPICERPRKKAIHLPQFQEDRLRLWRGPLGNGYSTALGERMPDTRTERDRLAAKKGIEFVSKSELLASNKEAAEAVAYKAHVDSGGPRDVQPAPAPDAFKEKPAWAKELTK